MEQSKKRIYERVKEREGIVWCFDTEKANVEAFKEYQRNRKFPKDKYPIKYFLRDKFIKYFVPNNIEYLKGQDKYLLNTRFPHRTIIQSSRCNFYWLCLAGWLFKLSNKILYKAWNL